MNRRPSPGPEPTIGAWLTVGRSIGRVLLEIGGSALRLVFFSFRREAWRRQIGERIAAGALPAGGAGEPSEGASSAGED